MVTSAFAHAKGQSSRSIARLWTSRLLKFVYGLVMFEVVIMISPFAFYFYTAYTPTLGFLDRHVATAWLTGFMLPHAVFTTSRSLEFMRWDLGRYCFGFGLLAFILLAAVVYGSKLFRRSAVFWGPYRYIRHPQYLCLGIAGFGLLTMWPRVIIFLFLVGMLFTYYSLARVEESRMLLQDANYADYIRRTGMFLPFAPGKRLYGIFFRRMHDQRRAHRLALAGTAALLLVAGAALRTYTVSHVSHVQLSPNLQVISVYPSTPERLRQVAREALADRRVQQALEHNANATFVAHILPTDYGMIGMFADVGPHHLSPKIHLARLADLSDLFLPFLDKDVRTQLMGSSGSEYDVVFSRVDAPSGRPVAAANVFALAPKMTPVYIAEVAASGKVVLTIDPPRTSFWGAVKMPVF